MFPAFAYARATSRSRQTPCQPALYTVSMYTSRADVNTPPRVTDIDECAERLDNCTRGQGQLCQNTDGGFNCIVRCQLGYRFSLAQGRCTGLSV